MFAKPYSFRTATLSAMYSAFAILKATKLCFLLHQETMAEPRVKHLLEVIFLSTALPAQSASTYLSRLRSTFVAYLRP
jgi:hypothetical protein